MSKKHIPLVDLKILHQPLREDLAKAFGDVFDSSAFILGRFVESFERELEQYLGVSGVVSLNSGTDALLLALKALGVGAGDEVITVPNSFYATVEAILLAGATPVFVDVEADTALMDITQVESKISHKTKALLPVHLYGQPVSMEPLLAMAKKHKLFVVEDACQAMGSVYQGKKAGTLGDVGCFSFYPGKNLGALGDGGALVASNPLIVEKIKKLRNHGGIKKYEHELIGYNSRLDAFQARFLSVKLPYLDGWNQERRELAQTYRKMLKEISGVRCLEVRKECVSNEHLFVIQMSPLKRDDLRKRLEEEGIETGIHYPDPLHQVLQRQGLYSKTESFPQAERLCQSILSLPLYAGLSVEEVLRVVACLKEKL